jgi:hypothetical protein
MFLPKEKCLGLCNSWWPAKMGAVLDPSFTGCSLFTIWVSDISSKANGLACGRLMVNRPECGPLAPCVELLSIFSQSRSLSSKSHSRKKIMNILVKIIHSNESLNFTSGPKRSLLCYSFNNNVRYVWIRSEYTWHIVNSTRTWFTISICMNWLLSS